MARAPIDKPQKAPNDDSVAQAPDPQPADGAESSQPADLALANLSAASQPVTARSGSNDGGDTYTVIARNGLNLRAGPGTQFSVLRLLPFGTAVKLLKREGDWALVDQIGDGAADGHVFNAYLELAPDRQSSMTVAAIANATDFVELDVGILQTIMNRCAGTTVKSPLDLDEVVYALNKAMPLAGAITKLREIAFLSQAVIETAYFQTYKEYGSLDYLKGKEYYPYYGRGLHQLTWKETYRTCSAAVFQDDRLFTDPDLILKDIEVNIKATAWYWRDNKPFNKLADHQDIDGIIHLLYGGTISSPKAAVRQSVILRRSYYTTIGSILS